jgi:hypothetical protein
MAGFPRTCVIVSGSRHWADRAAIERRLGKYPEGALVLHGAATGADSLAAEVASTLGMTPVPHPYFGELNTQGGPVRNSLLIELGKVYESYRYRVSVEAFPMPDSVGTLDLIAKARKAKFHVETDG